MDGGYQFSPAKQFEEKMFLQKGVNSNRLVSEIVWNLSVASPIVPPVQHSRQFVIGVAPSVGVFTHRVRTMVSSRYTTTQLLRVWRRVK